MVIFEVITAKGANGKIHAPDFQKIHGFNVVKEEVSGDVVDLRREGGRGRKSASPRDLGGLERRNRPVATGAKCTI